MTHRQTPHVADSFQESFESAHIDERYDLILSLDSWYLIGRNRAALDKALDLRATGGRLLIQLMSANRQFYWVLDQVRNLLSSNDLHAWVLEEGLEHEYFEHSHWVPLSKLVVGGQPTEGFKHFAAFAKGEPWDEFSDEAREEATQAAHDLQCEGRIETRHGYLLFR